VSKAVPHIIYQIKNNDLQQLKACISDVAMVTQNMLPNMWSVVEYNLNICHATGDTKMKSANVVSRKKSF
jgi:hypothetical protein